MGLVDFYETKLITHENITHEKIKIEQCEKINSIDEYSRYMIYDLHKHVDTDFVLVSQHDGFLVNPSSWSDEFFNYDYIGAPWPKNSFIDDKGECVRVGNGGFSLRSKRLMNIFSELNIEWKPYRGYYNEDGFISMANLDILRENGIKFPTAELAYRFSREITCEDLDNSVEPFGIHNFRDKNIIYKI